MPKKIDRPLPSPIPKRFHTNQLWVAQHYSGHSEIIAYSEISGEFENVLVVRGLSGYSAKTMAEFVLSVVNETILSESLMLNAMQTMREFLVENDFDPKVEKPVINLVERIGRTYGITQAQSKATSGQMKKT